MTSMCMREATSGNTPPYCACLAACEATTLDRMKRPSATTAAAVSSQEVSIARMRGMIKKGRSKKEGVGYNDLVVRELSQSSDLYFFCKDEIRPPKAGHKLLHKILMRVAGSPTMRFFSSH